MALNDQQLRFVVEYVALGNATKAAEAAGYSPKTAYAQGSRLLKHAEVRAAIDERQANLANELGLTRQWILEGLRAEATDPENKGSERIRARELLGKAHGMWVDRAQVDTTAMVTYTLDLGASLGDEGVDEDDEG